MALGSTQPITEMRTREFPGGECGRCVRLTLPPSCAVVMKSGNLNFLEPHGPLQACNGTALLLPPGVNLIVVNKYVYPFSSCFQVSRFQDLLVQVMHIRFQIPSTELPLHPRIKLIWTTKTKSQDTFKLYAHVTVHRDKFLIIKTTRCTNFSKFIFGMKFYMSRVVPLSIIRNFFTVHTAMVYVIQFFRQHASRIRLFKPDPTRVLSEKLYDIYHCCVYSEKNPDDGQRNCPKHVEFPSKINLRN